MLKWLLQFICSLRMKIMKQTFYLNIHYCCFSLSLNSFKSGNITNSQTPLTNSYTSHVFQSITGQKIPGDRFPLFQHPYIYLPHVAQNEIRCKMTLNVIPATYSKTPFNNLQNLITVVLRTSLNTKTKKGFLQRQTSLTPRNEEQLVKTTLRFGDNL